MHANNFWECLARLPSLYTLYSGLFDLVVYTKYTARFSFYILSVILFIYVKSM